MLSDLTEHMLTLTEAARHLPGRPHVSTLWRWYTRGVRGVRLETLVVGGRRYTSREALQRFSERLTGTEAVASTYRTPGQRRRASEQAGRALTELGI